MSQNLIIGAGAIGTVLAAYLLAARRETRIAILPEDVEKLGAVSHLQVDRITGRPPLSVPKPSLSTQPLPRAGENVFICVKYRDFPALLEALPEELAPGVRLIPCLNGLSATRQLRQRFPLNPVIPMSIMFNAQLLEPLHARVTAKPQLLLDTDSKDLLNLFGNSGVDVRRASGDSAAWGKLLINLANALCALTHTTFKDLLTKRDLTLSFVALLDEATEILDAAKISYRLPVNLPYKVYRAFLLFGGPLPWWAGKLRNNMSAGSYPSMVADVMHGQQTEVRQLNGEIVTLAEKNGLDAPMNRRLLELIEAVEGQNLRQFLSTSELRAKLQL